MSSTLVLPSQIQFVSPPSGEGSTLIIPSLLVPTASQQPTPNAGNLNLVSQDCGCTLFVTQQYPEGTVRTWAIGSWRGSSCFDSYSSTQNVLDYYYEMLTEGIGDYTSSWLESPDFTLFCDQEIIPLCGSCVFPNCPNGNYCLRAWAVGCAPPDLIIDPYGDVLSDCQQFIYTASPIALSLISSSNGNGKPPDPPVPALFESDRAPWRSLNPTLVGTPLPVTVGCGCGSGEPPQEEIDVDMATTVAGAEGPSARSPVLRRGGPGDNRALPRGLPRRQPTSIIGSDFSRQTNNPAFRRR